MLEIPVRGYHIDLFGHVNNARYLEFLESARWEAFTEPVEELKNRGLAITVVNINISYRKEARFGQVLVVDVNVAERGSRSLKFQQNVKDKATGALIAEAVVTCVIVDLQKQKAIPLDDSIIQLFT